MGLGELSKGMLGEEACGSLQGVTSAFLSSSETGSFGGREKVEGCTSGGEIKYCTLFELHLLCS